MQKYQNIVILTGAGISAESGLATFRAANGLWNNHRVEDVATVEAFARNPEYVHEFYNELKQELIRAVPNPAHLALAKLQQNYPAPVTIVTQKRRYPSRKSSKHRRFTYSRTNQPSRLPQLRTCLGNLGRCKYRNRLSTMRRSRNDETQHCLFRRKSALHG